MLDDSDYPVHMPDHVPQPLQVVRKFPPLNPIPRDQLVVESKFLTTPIPELVLHQIQNDEKMSESSENESDHEDSPKKYALFLTSILTFITNKNPVMLFYE